MPDRPAMPRGGRPARGGDAVARIQRSLAALFRLSASRRVHASRAAAAGALVSAPGLALLRQLADDGPSTLGELARATDMDPAAASRQVRQLEDDGLVTRAASARDGRAVVVAITPRGRSVSQRFVEVGNRHLLDAIERWSEADREAFAVLLARFVDDLRAARFRPAIEDRSA